MTHPLTDEICKQIVEDNVHWHPDSPLLDLTGKTCMRASYDMGREKGRAEQLKQAIEWMEENFYDYVCSHDEFGCEMSHTRMFADLRKAMRPQQ